MPLTRSSQNWKKRRPTISGVNLPKRFLAAPWQTTGRRNHLHGCPGTFDATRLRLKRRKQARRGGIVDAPPLGVAASNCYRSRLC